MCSECQAPADWDGGVRAREGDIQQSIRELLISEVSELERLRAPCHDLNHPAAQQVLDE